MGVKTAEGHFDYGMSDAAYFADTAIDQTGLKQYLVSPLAYVTRLEAPETPSAPLVFGTAAHALVLGSGAPVREAPDRRTKEGKATAARYEAEGATVLSKTDYEAATSMAAVTRPVFEAIGGRPEVAMLATDPATGLRIKGKADWLPDGLDEDGIQWIYDYKTTRSLDGFARSAADGGYHIQAAFYERLWRLCAGDDETPLGFRFIAQEKTPPYDYEVFELPPGDPDADYIVHTIADSQIDTALQGIAAYQSHKDWKERMRGAGRDHAPRPLRFTDWQLTAMSESIERTQKQNQRINDDTITDF